MNSKSSEKPSPAPASVVIDATNAIAGRLASRAAKAAVAGATVDIINAEKAVVSGDLAFLIHRYTHKRGLQNKANPEHSPKFPRRPDLFLKKMITGMLPKKSKRGAESASRIKAHLGAPALLAGSAKPFERTGERLSGRTTTLEVLCKRLGWKAA